jgi:hypothetical protein
MVSRRSTSGRQETIARAESPLSRSMALTQTRDRDLKILLRTSLSRRLAETIKIRVS